VLSRRHASKHSFSSVPISSTFVAQDPATTATANAAGGACARAAPTREGRDHRPVQAGVPLPAKRVDPSLSGKTCLAAIGLGEATGPPALSGETGEQGR